MPSPLASSKAKSSYKKTSKKYKNSKGVSCTVYKKGEKHYIKKLSKTTGKYTYRAVSI